MHGLFILQILKKLQSQAYFLEDSKACHPGGHYWDYYPGTLSLSQVTAPHLKAGHPQIKSTSARSSKELQRLDHMRGYEDSSPSNVHQGDTSH